MIGFIVGGAIGFAIGAVLGARTSPVGYGLILCGVFSQIGYLIQGNV